MTITDTNARRSLPASIVPTPRPSFQRKPGIQQAARHDPPPLLHEHRHPGAAARASITVRVSGTGSDFPAAAGMSVIVMAICCLVITAAEVFVRQMRASGEVAQPD